MWKFWRLLAAKSVCMHTAFLLFVCLSVCLCIAIWHTYIEAVARLSWPGKKQSQPDLPVHQRLDFI